MRDIVSSVDIFSSSSGAFPSGRVHKPVAASWVFFRLLAGYVIGKCSYLLARGPYEQIICASPTTGVFPCCRCTFHKRVVEYPPDGLGRSKSSSSWPAIGNFGQQQLCCLVARICVTYA